MNGGKNEVKKMENVGNVEMEFDIPNEIELKHSEWFEDPFPVKIIQIEKILKTGSWLVIGVSNENENGKIYKIYFPSYYRFFSEVKSKIDECDIVMFVEDNKIKFKDDLPF